LESFFVFLNSNRINPQGLAKRLLVKVLNQLLTW